MSDSPLRYFAEAYMHQDLDLDYGDIPGAAAVFAAYPLHDAAGLLRELEEVLSRGGGERALHREFDRLTAQYLPQKPDELHRQLVAAVTVLQAAVARRRLFVEALTEVLRSCHHGLPEDQVVRDLPSAAADALSEGLRELLSLARNRPSSLLQALHELTGEHPAGSPPEVERRLRAVLARLAPT